MEIRKRNIWRGPGNSERFFLSSDYNANKKTVDTGVGNSKSLKSLLHDLGSPKFDERATIRPLFQ